MIAKVLVSLFLVTGFSFLAHGQWYQSGGTCYAYTDCYNGWGQYTGRASCTVYSSSVAFGPGYNSNHCSWYVQPYVGVRCQGYQQVRVGHQYRWVHQDYWARCPGY